MAIHKYHVVLQDRIQLSDTRWEYTVNDLPRAAHCDQLGYVKSCNLSANATEQRITLTLQRMSSNRAISGYPLNKFVHVTCANFRLQTEDGKPTTFRESSEYIAKFLEHGLVLNRVRYSFYGHSNSQLKSRSCFLMAGSQEEVDRLVESLGDFSKIKTVAKKAKRIGLLFSTAHSVLSVDPARCRDIADVERNDYIFTDGCGKISVSLAQMLVRKKPLEFRNKRYRPSVFQIRYRGYKGVVTIEPKLPPLVWLELRKSMRKFSGGADNSFAVVEYSKPYTYGYLNDEIILLLHALGIAQEVLRKKQDEHLSFLETAANSPSDAFRFLASINCIELAEKCLFEGLESIENQLQKLVTQEHIKMLNKRSEFRCRILIPRSRLLFGVCDPYGVLKEGQCYINPTSDDDGVPHPLANTFVLVARNPCLHPGDLQKLYVVDRPELAHLIDCIVFPINGKRPSADMMSGGDLDGDTFFVCWDSDIVPAEISHPADYPGGKEPIQFSRITSRDRIDYFSRASSTQLGQVKNLFLKWARVKGPLSSECQELNRLFSQCVDANRIKVPERLKDPPQVTEANTPFICDVLHEAAKKRVEAYVKVTHLDSVPSEEALLSILADPIAMSHFELAQFTLHWCQVNRANFEDYWQYFDPTKLSTEQRAWLMSNFPAHPLRDEIIANDLMHSSILSHTELSRVGLRSTNIRWRCVFNSSTGRLANLLDILYRNFPFFTRKLLVLNIHERLSVAMYLPKTVNPMDDFPFGTCGRLFAFPHSKDAKLGVRVRVPTKHDTHLYYDHNKFEIFDGKRGNTFIFLTKGANDQSKYQNLKGRGRQARARESTIQDGVNLEWRSSIALAKFSQGLATHIGRLYREGITSAELYVISNTDTRSLHNLDLWLEQIDTDKVHHNFVNHENEFVEVPNLANIDLNDNTDLVKQVTKGRQIDRISTATPADMARILELAWLTSSTELAHSVCSTWFRLLRENCIPTSALEVLTQIVNFLSYMPSLVIYLVRLCPWTNLQPTMGDLLRESAPQQIRALILCANSMDRMIANHIIALLLELEDLSINGLKSMIEHVALTVASPETALDISLEGIASMVSRLLPMTRENSEYLAKQLTAIAVDHIEEAADCVKSSKGKDYLWWFKYPLVEKSGELLLKCDYRIDAPKTIHLAVGDHARFKCFHPPSNTALPQPASFEVLVENSQVGQITFQCMRQPPAWYQQCPWTLENCGSFVTAQTTIDAVTKLMVEKDACCDAFTSLFTSQDQTTGSSTTAQPKSSLASLNESQRRAVVQSLLGRITCIWGPPGTGKTHTIVTIIHEILASDEEKRLLVTAPTHNAVDHVMRQYLKSISNHELSQDVKALRVSTDLRKVSEDLRAHTCDAMLGKDINQFPSARKKAQQQITKSRLIFTTCIGAGLGLLRNERFENVIIDEASQQTEPTSLVPIVKGSSRIVLVGDHVQLRATVRPNAQAMDFDVSLFERLWTETEHIPMLQKVMLDTQYRMHPDLCAFPSQEFYESRLKTASHCDNIALPPSAFPWPANGSRAVFIPASAPEDMGHKSKANTEQARVCEEVVRLLRSASVPPKPSHDNTSTSTTTAPQPPPPTSVPYTIAILTPYTRQADLLRRMLPNETISSIDGFQGQEADVIVYVTVRCNLRHEIGFLRDMRRLNVAVTRAKAAIVVIGNEDTLVGKGWVGGDVDDDDGGEGRDREACFEVWARLVRSLTEVKVEVEVENADANT